MLINQLNTTSMWINGILLIALCSIALSSMFIAVVSILSYKESKKRKVIERIIVKPVGRYQFSIEKTDSNREGKMITDLTDYSDPDATPELVFKIKERN